MNTKYSLTLDKFWTEVQVQGEKKKKKKKNGLEVPPGKNRIIIDRDYKQGLGDVASL